MNSNLSHSSLAKQLSRVSLAILLILTGFTISLPSTTGKQNQIALSQPLTIKWRYDSNQTSNLTPAADGSLIYLPLVDGTLVSLNAADGKLAWKAEVGGNFSA